MTNSEFIAAVSRPADLSPAERAACVRIVKQGSAVNPNSAAYEIPRATLLAVLRVGAKIIGTGSIKRKRTKYAAKVAQQSHHPFDPETLELGYIAIDKKYRGKHLSHRLLSALLCEYDKPLFATTSNQRMKSALADAGFLPKGDEWKGDSGQLSLWLRD